MKPKNIYLVRHGESEANIDKNIYAVKPDYMISLTEKGREQAKKAGEILKEKTKGRRIFFYVSPLYRTRETFDQIALSFEKENYTHKEDPRIREQEWGHLRDLKTNIAIRDAQDEFGVFYYRIPDGESGADVYDRVSDFFNTLYRDFDKIASPQDVVIITHGMAILVFLMRWFHWSVEEFEALAYPNNCDIIHLELNERINKYRLNTELKKRTKK